jgi:hypothetical protein
LEKQIRELSLKLSQHPLYKHLSSTQNVRTFMEYHCFAVFDFMCLLKSLQKHMTLNYTPWIPSPYPDQIVRFINEIVLGEESDIGLDGQPCSHFHLYIKAMSEAGAETQPILNFIKSIKPMGFEKEDIPKDMRDFTTYNLELAMHGEVEEVAGAFLYGREKLIPLMFQGLLDSTSILTDFPSLIYYLKRHIDVDGNEHGPMAEKCLHAICGHNSLKLERAQKAALRSLELRSEVWDRCLHKIKTA